MPVWLELLDVLGLLVLLVVLYGVALVVRRRVLSRNGSTFELSHRLSPGDDPARGWLLGLGRYSGEELQWFRIFTLGPRPRCTWARTWLTYDGARDPEGMERTVLYPDHVVVTCHGPGGEIDLAMGRDSLTGFQAWLEARPPGTDWSR